MKSQMLALVGVFSLLASSTIPSQVARKDFDPLGEMVSDLPRVIRVQAEFIELPLANYTKLMAQPRNSAHDSDLRESCAKLVAAGKATIIETLSVNALPAQSATSENVYEFTYPSEPDGGGLGSLPIADNPTLRSFIPGSPPVPSMFDIKNVGSTFEVDAQITAMEPIVELRFTPTIVYHVAENVWSTWDNDEVTIETSTPRFYVLSVKTGTTLVSGETQMVAALSPQNDQGWMNPTRKVMVFIRADIITVGK